MGARFALFPIAPKRVLGGGRAHWEGGVRAFFPTFVACGSWGKESPKYGLITNYKNTKP